MLCQITISKHMQKIRNGPGRSRKLWPNVRYADTLGEPWWAWKSTDGKLRLNVGLSSYKDFNGTNLNDNVFKITDDRSFISDIIGWVKNHDFFFKIYFQIIFSKYFSKIFKNFTRDILRGHYRPVSTMDFQSRHFCVRKSTWPLVHVHLSGS